MTRGTFFLLLKDMVLSSQEFNGDMYPDGNGDQAFELLKSVSTKKEFHSMVEKFNEDFGYKYQGCLVFANQWNDVIPKMDFNNEYFNLKDKFCRFSDRIFIANHSGADRTFLEKGSGNPITLKDGETIRFNYGRFPEEDESKDEDEEDTDEMDREHIAEQIKQGYNHGILNNGSWDLTITR